MSSRMADPFSTSLRTGLWFCLVLVEMQRQKHSDGVFVSPQALKLHLRVEPLRCLQRRPRAAPSKMESGLKRPPSRAVRQPVTDSPSGFTVSFSGGLFSYNHIEFKSCSQVVRILNIKTYTYLYKIKHVCVFKMIFFCLSKYMHRLKLGETCRNSLLCEETQRTRIASSTC